MTSYNSREIELGVRLYGIIYQIKKRKEKKTYGGNNESHGSGGKGKYTEGG